MPGIDVKDNGSIEYQGLAINKFYIEGNDLLGGKYGVATNGISANDIGMVEVLENHQPMQVLSGIGLSDQAAINLKLKNKSKRHLVAEWSVSWWRIYATQGNGMGRRLILDESPAKLSNDNDSEK